jgi:hypothetical protein
MAFITGLNRPQGNERRSIAVLLQNFDLVTEQVNGNLDDSNIRLRTWVVGRPTSGLLRSRGLHPRSSALTRTMRPTRRATSCSRPSCGYPQVGGLGR